MTTYSCPACQSTEYSAELPYQGSVPAFTGKTIRQCSRCRLLSAHPMPNDEDLSQYYQVYWANCDECDSLGVLEQQAAARHQFIEPFLPRSNPLKVLDFGAGFGSIKSAFTSSVDYDAVEVDTKAVKFLREHGVARNIYASTHEIREQYDVLVLSHVLEHLKNPKEVVGAQRALLREGGILFVEVPNKDFMYKPRNEPHLLFFELQTLVALIESLGFKVLRADTCGKSISALNGAQVSAGARLRGTLKSLIPAGLLEKIRRARMQRSSAAAIPHVSIYGGDRQWLRLVAVKQ